MEKATLALTLTNASGGDLNDFATIDVMGVQISNHYQNTVKVQRTVNIEGIEAGAFTLYRVEIWPSNYRPVSFFANLSAGRTTSEERRFPVDPQRVKGLEAPPFAQLTDIERRLLANSEVPRFVDANGNFRTGDQLYEALQGVPRLQACLLNITTKSAATLLQDGKSCLDHYAGMIRLEQDRIFVRTTAALREEVQNSPAFHSVSTALHDPVPGYTLLDSYKTFDHFGNLQLTFQRRGATGGDYVADVDIDDAQGIEHIFQVLRNFVKGPTDPYDIHEILIASQQLDPRYSFSFPKAAVVAG